MPGNYSICQRLFRNNFPNRFVLYQPQGASPGFERDSNSYPGLAPKRLIYFPRLKMSDLSFS